MANGEFFRSIPHSPFCLRHSSRRTNGLHASGVIRAGRQDSSSPLVRLRAFQQVFAAPV
jgi:hypothetical protein